MPVVDFRRVHVLAGIISAIALLASADGRAADPDRAERVQALTSFVRDARADAIARAQKTLDDQRDKVERMKAGRVVRGLKAPYLLDPETGYSFRSATDKRKAIDDASEPIDEMESRLRKLPTRPPVDFIPQIEMRARGIGLMPIVVTVHDVGQDGFLGGFVLQDGKRHTAWILDDANDLADGDRLNYSNYIGAVEGTRERDGATVRVLSLIPVAAVDDRPEP